MLFRQLVDLRSSTYTYVLAGEESGEAVIIDPVFEQFSRDAALLRELGLRLLFTVETHVHADHVTGAWLLREALGARIAVPAGSGAEGADLLVRDGDRLSFGRHALHALATPGHTAACTSYVADDRTLAFTGDALMIRSAGRTDFQQGDARRLYRSVHEKLFTLPPRCLVYPAHDYAGRTCTSVGEERAFNPRLGGGRLEDDFVGYMENLGLPHPKQIDVALPANLRCGRPESGRLPAGDWAPALRTFGGVLEVQPEWLAEHLAEVTVLDVREPAEWRGELGRIDGAMLLPLGELRARLGELPRDRPIVAVCRSGARSAQAQQILENAGLARAANLNGGMLRWRSLELPVAAP
jgi:sulfur dioxygenase